MADHPSAPLAAKVLTVSDGVVNGTREDASGAALVAQLSGAGFTVAEHEVCADGADVVAAALRDQSPEGTRLVVEREAPGLAEAMRLVSPLGRLSRGIAGVAGQAIICNTPGSPKGCVEQLGAILDILPHALTLLADAPTSH